MAFIVILSFVVFSGSIFWLAVAFFRKKRKKKILLTMFISFLTLSFSANSMPASDEKDETKETVESKKENVSKENEKENKLKDDKADREKEAAKKKEEVKKKEEEAKKKKEEAKKKEEQRKIDSDITILTEEPTIEQQTTLSTLADMQFQEQYPYKGSKMHTILGILQDWTSTDGSTWFYKVEATIVNAYGAERKANVEVHITPNGPDSGYVEFIDY